MIEMASRDIIPAVNEYVADVANGACAKKSFLKDVDCSIEERLVRHLSELNAKAYAAVEALRCEEAKAAATANVEARAESYCHCVLPAMTALRACVDEMETMVASEYWPLPSYGDMMFRV